MTLVVREKMKLRRRSLSHRGEEGKNNRRKSQPPSLSVSSDCFRKDDEEEWCIAFFLSLPTDEGTDCLLSSAPANEKTEEEEAFLFFFLLGF